MSNYFRDYEYEMSSSHKEAGGSLEKNTKWRVKLYHLNEDGQWDDKGTGYVQILKEVIIKE